jgi:hypothetical protein
MMSKFEDLCELAARWQDEGHNNWMRLSWAALRLTRGFAKYIDAEGVYADPKNGQAIRYVETMRHGSRSDGTNVPQPAQSYIDALEMDAEGFVRFSIATAFERSPTSYPKIRVGVFLRMKITGDTLHVQLLNKRYIPFGLDINDASTDEKLFEAIVELLETSFKTWDDERPSIGFDLTPASSIEPS